MIRILKIKIFFYPGFGQRAQTGGSQGTKGGDFFSKTCMLMSKLLYAKLQLNSIFVLVRQLFLLVPIY